MSSSSKHVAEKASALKGFGILAAGSLISGSLVVAANATPTSPDCVSPDPNITPTIINGTICEIRFVAGDDPTQLTTAWNFTVPAGVPKVGALLIGAGGAGFKGTSGSTNLFAGGGGGAVTYDEKTGSGQFTLRLEAGVAGDDGLERDSGWWDTTYRGPASAGFAPGGGSAFLSTVPEPDILFGGNSYDPSGLVNRSLVVVTGTPASSFAVSGAGTGGVGADYSNELSGTQSGGPGASASDLGADSFLWPVGSGEDEVFGAGGSVALSPASFGVPTQPGTGGWAGLNASNAPIATKGAPGAIIIRFRLPNPVPTATPTPTPTATETTPPTPQPYMGPIPSELSPGVVPTAGQTVRLSGERLESVTKIEISGVEATLVSKSANSIEFIVPALTSGTYSVNYYSSFGRLTHQDSLIVRDTPRIVEPRRIASKRFTGFAGDSSSVTLANQLAMSQFVSSIAGAKSVTCVGSTSGVPAARSDRRLALERARQACDVVEQLVPGLSTKELTSVGRGTGPNFRSVTLFITY